MLCRLLGQEIFGGNNASIVYGRQREKVMHRKGEKEREAYTERERERKGERKRRAGHRVCLLCKVFAGNPCAQQFKIDEKKIK